MSKLLAVTCCELKRVSNEGVTGGSTSNMFEIASDTSQFLPSRDSPSYDNTKSVYDFDCTVLSSIVNAPAGNVPTVMPGCHSTQFGPSTPAACTGFAPPSRRDSGR